jgi:transcriptional regulator with XRE-family HTH domain
VTLLELVKAQYSDPNRFIANLKSRMRLHGISQYQMAKRSGVSAKHIARWLTDNPKRRVRPTIKSMLILDETMDKLTEGE